MKILHTSDWHNIFQLILKKMVKTILSISLISIFTLLTATAQSPIISQMSVQYYQDSVYVNIKVINKSCRTIYLSTDGLESWVTDSSKLLINYDYLEFVSDPLLMPEMKIKVKQLSKGKTWEIGKGKKTNSLKEVQFYIDIFYADNVKNRHTYSRLEKGYLFLKEFFFEVGATTYSETFEVK